MSDNNESGQWKADPWNDIDDTCRELIRKKEDEFIKKIKNYCNETKALSDNKKESDDIIDKYCKQQPWKS